MISVVNPYSIHIKKSRIIGTFFLVLGVASCGESSKTSTPAIQNEEIENGTYVSISGPTQGTTYNITYKANSNKVLQPVIDSILIDFDNSLSTYNPGSKISEFNGYGEVELDKYLQEVYLLSRRIYQETEGAFNPAIYPIVELWGFGNENASIVTQEEIDSLMAFTSFQEVQIDAENDLLIATNKNRIEFNGIAQGYSVDVIGDYLSSLGIKDWLVEIGGEIRVSGLNKKGEPWKLGIERPVEEKQSSDFQQVVSLTNAALATSGNYRNYREVNGRRVSHTMNPYTGYPSDNNVLSVSVIANTAAEADAYATAFMVMGVNAAQDFLKEFPEYNLSVLIVFDNEGEYAVWQSQGLRDLAAN